MSRAGFDSDRANAIMQKIEELQNELKYTLSGQFNFSARSDDDEGTRSGEKGKEEADSPPLPLDLTYDEELDRVFGEAIANDEKRQKRAAADMTKVISPAALSRLHMTNAERTEARMMEIAAEKERRIEAFERAKREKEINRKSVETYLSHAKPHEYQVPVVVAAKKQQHKKKKWGTPWQQYNPKKRTSSSSSIKRARDPYQGGDWLGGGTRSDRAGGVDRK
jgi:hypothetical protein